MDSKVQGFKPSVLKITEQRQPFDFVFPFQNKLKCNSTDLSYNFLANTDWTGVIHNHRNYKSFFYTLNPSENRWISSTSIVEV